MNDEGRLLKEWVDTRDVLATPYDTPIPGYGNRTVNTLRLWAAKAVREFDLDEFNEGDYIGAIEARARSENICRVLYPNDNVSLGQELRLAQEYFFVSATLQDIIRRYKKRYQMFDEPLGLQTFDRFADKVAIQLNDTHPALAIPELMRILVDTEELGWDEAWDITTRTFGYTNHTVMPEALERWPVAHDGHHAAAAPRDHLRDQRAVPRRRPPALRRRRRALPAHVHHRGGRRQARPHGRTSPSWAATASTAWPRCTRRSSRRACSATSTSCGRRSSATRPTASPSAGGSSRATPTCRGSSGTPSARGWVTDLYQLRKLTRLADDPAFGEAWRAVKRQNKLRLADIIRRQYDRRGKALSVDPDSLFDVQVKRIHEYKRQLLNVLHVITLYNRIMDDPNGDVTPRTVIFGGKAAPGYLMAKLIIRLINDVGEVVNNDPRSRDRLRVVFVADYRVSLAERIFPAAELSEQISTAGTEASGTGNMKFALNGALTIGTMDGANVEIREEVGEENIFIFGLTAEQAAALAPDHDPWEYYRSNGELKRVLDMIQGGAFSGGDPDRFRPIVDSLLSGGDRYLLLADYASYVEGQERVARTYRDRAAWTRKSILNAAGTGKFSSDRTIEEYAREIWGVVPVPV